MMGDFAVEILLLGGFLQVRKDVGTLNPIDHEDESLIFVLAH